MNKNLLKFGSLLSILFIAGCTTNTSSSQRNSSTSTHSSKVEESSKISTSTKEDSSVVSSTSSSSNNSSSSSSSSEEYPVVDDEDKYIVDESKRVNVTINVSLPESNNEIYIIGDFNNWGKFNTLNDTSYRVNNGVVSLSNIENGVNYEYMFVQKIQDATYTYNFNMSQVDSEGNQVIGYTKDGQLISQYCISQADSKFSFVASEGASVTSVVTSWKDALFGETIEVSDPNKSYDVPTSGYNLCVSPASDPANVYYIPLEARTDVDGEGRQQYAAYNVVLEEGDAFTIYDGNNNTGWAETSVETYGAGSLFAVNTKLGVCALEAGTYDIYVKLAYENNRIYIEKSGSSSDDGGNNNGNTTAPTSGYALLVTPGNGGTQYYIPLTQVDEFDGFQQHMADNVVFSSGDTFVLYDCTNAVSWVEDTLSPYGQYQNFSATQNGIVCNVPGTYDIYVKFKFEQDEIYIGNQDGA